YVFTTVKKETTSCQNCHGTDLKGGTSGISCFSCHPSYPHGNNWKLSTEHGPAAYGNLKSDSKSGCSTANCHGTDFNGSAQAPSCFNCHDDFPHTNSKWTTLEVKRESLRDESFHGDRFIQKIKRGEVAACTECHGTNYDRSVGGKQCTGCHTTGITHHTTNNVDWNSGGGHGKYFSNSLNSLSQNTNCQNCHGSAVNFDVTQTTKTVLTHQSYCYSCHKAYPHKSYTTSGLSWDSWEPVVSCTSDSIGYGHTFYLMPSNRSPLFTDANGNAPSRNTNDPSNLEAIKASCAGSTESSCHNNGYRSYRGGNPVLLCSGSCHKSSLPERSPCPSP
ncbi:MAG: hypothetical protein Q7S00_06190, partial [bacterium]|nr:hypothetical protein [bacterium]